MSADSVRPNASTVAILSRSAIAATDSSPRGDSEIGMLMSVGKLANKPNRSSGRYKTGNVPVGPFLGIVDDINETRRI